MDRRRGEEAAIRVVLAQVTVFVTGSVCVPPTRLLLVVGGEQQRAY